MSVPSVVIVLGLEAAPLIYVDARREGEAQRLAFWLASHPDVAALLQRAIELAEKARAA